MRQALMSFMPWKIASLSSNAYWVLAQQVILRGLVALKFLALGRVLGPVALGTVSIALLIVAFAEAVSDTGLSQALIQRKAAPSHYELGAIWTLLGCRGAALCAGLILIGPFIAGQFHVVDSAAALQLVAALPLIRGAISPTYLICLRERKFKTIAFFEISAAVVDFALSLTLALAGLGVYAVVIGMLAGEVLKSILTWWRGTVSFIPNFKWSMIKQYSTYSRWIWFDSVINNLVLNQFDKIVVGKLLGPGQLGPYQMGAKLAQMVMFDMVFAMAQYFFPTFAASHHANPAHARTQLLRVAGILAVGLVCLGACVQVFAGDIIRLLLGPKWDSATPLFRVFVLTMAVKAIATLLTAYLRATGRPNVTTQSLVVQIVVLVIAVPYAVMHWGVTGVAWAIFPSIVAGVVWMSYQIARTKA